MNKKNCTTFIKISENEKITVIIKNEEETREIKLRDNDISSTYNLNIRFYKFYYDVCLENEENVIKNIIKKLTKDKQYFIEFQNNPYELQYQDYLVMIIDEFMKIIKN